MLFCNDICDNKFEHVMKTPTSITNTTAEYHTQVKAKTKITETDNNKYRSLTVTD